ncbi:MAG: alpha/beta hydrolase [Alphaproteobacteria bacterium]|nr:alpha/beta hydrolase [Alphaproteobacteria bacterium]
MDVRYDEFDTGEIRLHYAAMGNPANPLILCLHGFPEYWAAWQSVMPLLADRHFVVAPDQRGFGRSSKPAGVDAYQTRHLLADIAALADHLSAENPFVLFGHDWGSAVAYAYAFRHPDRLKGLVVANGVHPATFQRAIVDDPKQRAASQYMSWLRADNAADAMSADNFSRTLNMIAGFSATDWMSEEDKNAYREAWSGEGTMEAMLNWYRASPVVVPPIDTPASELAGAVPVLDLPDEVLQVRMPHLVVWGERDEALRPVCLDGLDRYAPDLKVVRFSDAGHWILHEQAAGVAQAVDAWIDEKGLY